MSGGGGQTGSTSGSMSLMHGGGNQNLSSDKIMQLGQMNSMLKDPNLDPQVRQSLLASQSELLSNDNGGYLGMLGRMVTGTGQTGAEKFGGGALQLGTGVLRNILAQNALAQQNQNMANAQAQSVANQRNMLGRGMF